MTVSKTDFKIFPRLEIRDVPLKGRGIFSTRKFFQGEFVVEYAGDLITPKEAEVRDAKEEFFSQALAHYYDIVDCQIPTF